MIKEDVFKKLIECEYNVYRKIAEIKNWRSNSKKLTKSLNILKDTIEEWEKTFSDEELSKEPIPEIVEVYERCRNMFRLIDFCENMKETLEQNEVEER